MNPAEAFEHSNQVLALTAQGLKTIQNLIPTNPGQKITGTIILRLHHPDGSITPLLFCSDEDPNTTAMPEHFRELWLKNQAASTIEQSKPSDPSKN